MARCTRYNICDQVCQWLAADWWFSPVSSTNKTDHHDITEIVLKVARNTIILTLSRLSLGIKKKQSWTPWSSDKKAIYGIKWNLKLSLSLTQTHFLFLCTQVCLYVSGGATPLPVYNFAVSDMRHLTQCGYGHAHGWSYSDTLVMNGEYGNVNTSRGLPTMQMCLSAI